jgi:hypothetical protein
VRRGNDGVDTTPVKNIDTEIKETTDDLGYSRRQAYYYIPLKTWNEFASHPGVLFAVIVQENGNAPPRAEQHYYGNCR